MIAVVVAAVALLLALHLWVALVLVERRHTREMDAMAVDLGDLERTLRAHLNLTARWVD